MKTMNQSLCELVTKRLVSHDDARERSTDVEDFDRTFQMKTDGKGKRAGSGSPRRRR